MNPGGNTVVDLVGRPSNAVGKSPLFKQYVMKGWNKAANKKEASKYTLDVVRKIMKDSDGKQVKFI